MNVLVTGGCGFIGTNLVRLLVTERPGWRVVNVDKLTYAGNPENLADLEGHPRYRFVRGDVCNGELLGDVLRSERIDAIMHLAAESHVDRSILAPAVFIDTNVRGTQVLLEVAREHGVQRFLHVSTDEVYGSIDHGSWREESPLAPNSPYAASKAASDLLVLACHRTHGLDVVVTRCSNNYGHYQFPEKVIPLFITNLLDGRPVPLYGDGGNSRDWLHVSDHCLGVQLALLSGKAGEVYHIGGGTELTNRELTARLLDACGASWDMVEHVTDRPGHDRRYSLDTTKISEQLGYAPRVSFGEGLARTVDWYRANRQWWEPLKAAVGHR
jgi:dTDP-glucose 4,6-dehydratase